jgi:hypothetical protein
MVVRVRRVGITADMTLLDDVIDSSHSDDVSTNSLLRKMITLGYRLRSDELINWAKSELNGYGGIDVADLPFYRGPLKTPVEGSYIGPGNSQRSHWIDEGSVPDVPGFRDAHFYTYLNQPLAELQRLIEAEIDPSEMWSNRAVAQLNQWGDQGIAHHFELMHANSVRKIITRPSLHGVIDAVRTNALLFALDLQRNYPKAGEPDGPTTQTEDVRQMVTMNIHNNIYGGTNTLANGERVVQNVQINQGDSVALLRYLKDQGLDAKGQSELKAAIEAEDASPGERVQGFLRKVGAGALSFGQSVAVPTAVAAAKKALGSYYGFEIP